MQHGVSSGSKIGAEVSEGTYRGMGGSERNRDCMVRPPSSSTVTA